MDHEEHLSLSPESIRNHLNRVVASAAFANAERMSRFLRFVVETTLEGRGAELKEYAIGVAVFDRRPTYDPRVDPIVRVEARRLRSKLTAYYETDGRGSDVLILLTKGSYAPRFISAAAPMRPRKSPRALSR